MNGTRICMAVAFLCLGLGSAHALTMVIWFLASALWFAWGVLDDGKAENVPLKTR